MNFGLHPVFDDSTHPNREDFMSGFEAGCATNPYAAPGARTGVAREAYDAGFEAGSRAQDDYLDAQED